MTYSVDTINMASAVLNKINSLLIKRSLQMTTYLYKRNAIIRSNRYILIDNLVCQDGRVLVD